MKMLYFLGIDVSKKNLDAALTLDGKAFYQTALMNEFGAIQMWFEDMRKKFNFSNDQVVVCLEHTGIYCQPLLDFFFKYKMKVCLESALQIKKSQGITRGKNDRIDASRIASYAIKNHNDLKFWSPQRTCVQRLKSFLGYTRPAS